MKHSFEKGSRAKGRKGGRKKEGKGEGRGKERKNKGREEEVPEMRKKFPNQMVWQVTMTIALRRGKLEERKKGSED